MGSPRPFELMRPVLLEETAQSRTGEKMYKMNLECPTQEESKEGPVKNNSEVNLKMEHFVSVRIITAKD